MKKLFLLLFALMFVSFVSAAPTVSFFLDVNSLNNTKIIKEDVVRDSSAIFHLATNEEAECRFSTTQGVSYNSMPGVFDLSLGNSHKENLFGLEDGVHKYYVKCKKSSGFISGELEAVFSVSTPISAIISLSKDSPVGPGLLEINLETSKPAQYVPELSYSFDGSDYDPVPLSGSGSEWSGFIIIPDNVGEVVGSFKFKAFDIEGNLGTRIEDGAVFLADSIKPKTIIDFDAIGNQGRVDLTWKSDEESEIDYYNIYRSTSSNPGFSDFFKKTEDDSYSDTLVENGKTYYYRITAVDEAGNEGDLSIEAYATALLSSAISSTGLDTRLYGSVDGLISEINLVLSDVSGIESSMSSKSEKDRQIFTDLSLNSEFSSVKSELNALKREVENFKTQSLTENELNKKLDSSRLKVNTLKKKIPENIVIVSEKSNTLSFSEEDVRSVLLELNRDLEINSEKKRIEMTLEESDFSVSSEAYNLDLIYLDGTKREVFLIKKKMSRELNGNFSIIEYIPKELAGSVSDIEIRKGNYRVLKEDPILEFDSSDAEIVYSLNGHGNLANVDRTKTFPLHEEIEISPKTGILTGAFAFSGSGIKGGIGFIVGLIVIGSLGAYFVYLRSNNKHFENVKPVKEKFEKMRKEIEKGDFEQAKSIYEEVCSSYKELDEKSQKKLYPEVISLNKEVGVAYFKQKFNDINDLALHDKELARNAFENVKEEYDSISEDVKKELNSDYEGLNNEFGNS